MPELRCSSAAELLQIMAITGTWSPATISTATAGTTTYTFTPACRSVCYYNYYGYCGNY